MSRAINKRASFPKKLAVSLVSFLAVLLLLLVLVPRWIDVERFRKPLVSGLNQRLNGHLELGALHLSLWKGVRFEAEGLRIEDARGRPVVSADQVEVSVPLESMLRLSPEFILRIPGPELFAIRDSDGTVNLLGLWRSTDKPIRLPRALAGSRFSLKIQDAAFTYSDLPQGKSIRLSHLELSSRNMSLHETMNVRLHSEVDASFGDGGRVRGPIDLDLQLTPTLGVKGGTVPVTGISGNLSADFTPLAMTLPGSFEKKPGTSARFNAEFQASPSEIRLAAMTLRILNAEVTAQGRVTRLDVPVSPSEKAAVEPPPPILELTLQSNEVDLTPWREVIPVLKSVTEGSLASGTVLASARLNGPLDQLDYSGEFAMRNAGFRLEGFKVPATLDAAFRVSTNAIDSLELRLSAPGSDLRLTGALVSLTAPRGTLTFESSGLDLDQLLALQASSDQPEVSTPSPSRSTSPGGGADIDALLAPLRENAVIRASRIRVTGAIAVLKFLDVRVTELSFAGGIRDLVFAFDRFSGKLWSGAFQGEAAADLKPEHPTYRFSMQSKGIALQEAAESRWKWMEGTLLGDGDFRVQGSGASFNTESALTNLNAKGSFVVSNGSFVGVDFAAIGAKGVNDAIDRVSKQIPGLGGRNLAPSVSKAAQVKVRYRRIGSDFVISKALLALPTFSAVADKRSGIDVRGTVQISLQGEHVLNARLEAIDTWNILGANEVGLDIAGHGIDHLFSVGDGPVRFPITLAGNLKNPQVVAREIPLHLASVALGKVADTATGTLKQEADKVLKSMPREIREALRAVPDLLPKK